MWSSMGLKKAIKWTFWLNIDLPEITAHDFFGKLIKKINFCKLSKKHHQNWRLWVPHRNIFFEKNNYSRVGRVFIWIHTQSCWHLVFGFFPPHWTLLLFLTLEDIFKDIHGMYAPISQSVGIRCSTATCAFKNLSLYLCGTLALKLTWDGQGMKQWDQIWILRAYCVLPLTIKKKNPCCCTCIVGKFQDMLCCVPLNGGCNPAQSFCIQSKERLEYWIVNTVCKILFLKYC